MAAHKEIEIKFRVDNLRTLKQNLRRSGFRLLTRRTLEMNTLYDLPGERLRKRGELLRLRKFGETWTITHKAKGRIGRHKTRVETESQVAEGPKMEIILQSLGLVPGFRYEKFRAEWSDGRGHVVVDETPIGNFAEIEGRPRWIDQTARHLRVPRDSYITDTYAGLFFAWKKLTGSRAHEMTFRSVAGIPRRQLSRATPYAAPK